MKRFFLLALVAPLVSLSAFATTYTFEESGGSLNLVHSVRFGDPLQLRGSKIVRIDGPSLHMASSKGGTLGTLKLSGAHLVKTTITGSKQGGSITDVDTFGSGTMSILNSLRQSSLPHGEIFNGTFDSETLTVTSDYSEKLNARGKPVYFLKSRAWQLVGHVVGKLYNGRKLSGSFDISRSAGVTAGSANLSAVPEPGTLLLLATGLLSIAGLVRRRSPVRK